VAFGWAKLKGLLGFGIAAGAVIVTLIVFGFGHPPTTSEPLNSWYLTHRPPCEPTFAGDCVGHNETWVGQFDGAAIYAVVAGVVLVAVAGRRIAGWMKR
jgi:hypothetical protein